MREDAILSMWFYLLCVLVAYYVAKKISLRWRYDLHRIPSPPGIPIFGHALLLKQAMKSAPISAVFRTWKQELGNSTVMKVNFFGRDFVYVMDADTARNIILAKSGGMPRSPDITREWHQVIHPCSFYGFGIDSQVLSGDPKARSFFLMATSTPYVKAFRRTMARCMTSTALRHQIPKLHKVWLSLQSIIDNACLDGAIDIEDLLVRCTLDAAGSVFFDHDFGELEKGNSHRKKILEALLTMKRVALNPLKKFKVAYLPFLKEVKDIQAKYSQVVDLWHDIALKIRERVDSGNPDVNMWAALKQFKNPETDALLDIKLLRSEVGTAIVGGMDTTAHTMAWTLALLSSHPHVTDKIVDELKTHGLVGSEAREIDFDDLSKLEYLIAVLKEAMRLVHVPVATRRILGQDMIICGYRLPKGTLVYVAGTNMVNSEEDWDDPLEFKPERWRSGEDMSKKFYFPFSYGDRDCIGQRYAMLLMQYILSNIIAKYRFQLIKGESFQRLFEKQVLSVVVESRNGIHMNIERRK